MYRLAMWVGRGRVLELQAFRDADGVVNQVALGAYVIVEPEGDRDAHSGGRRSHCARRRRPGAA
jgi:hypothetical protein